MSKGDRNERTVPLDRGATSSDVRFSLVCIAGIDKGKSFDVDPSSPTRALVGTSPACSVSLTDPHVSRRHAALEVERDRLRIVDLGSTNGFRVQGVEVIEARLSGGEVVQIGRTTLRLDVVRAPENPVRNDVDAFGKLKGRSAAMQRLYPLCARLAAADVPLLIEGETGTGKEVLAESIHEASPRANAPFVVFDCTAVVPTLLEAALFGHERGAFTGANEARAGVFEEAHGGTLFVDEIGDLDVALQAKLLRALERGEVRRIGGKSWMKVDVRVLAATRRDLDREIQAGKFRDDLFYRLVIARIELPPLRKREGDVELLARHFWQRVARGEPFPVDVLDRWDGYAWPGNVRELQNAIVRRFALGDLEMDANVSVRGSLPPDAPATTNVTPPSSGDVMESVLARNLQFPAARDLVLFEFERRYVERVLAAHGGNVARAAEASGIARRYFQLIRARRARAKSGE